MPKQRWQDIGNPKQRHAGKVAEQQARERAAQPQPTQAAQKVQPAMAQPQPQAKAFEPYKGVEPAKAWNMQWQALPTAPRSGFASKPIYQKIAQDRLGYVPSFYENPTNVAQMQHMIESGQEAPGWVDKDMVRASYEYFKLRNQDKPWTEWGYLDPADPARPLLQSLGTPPAEFLHSTMPRQAQRYSNPDAVKQGKMMWQDLSPDAREAILSDPQFYQAELQNYPLYAQQEILADPNFNWDYLPDWQKNLFGFVSNPAYMATPIALAGGRAGAQIGGMLGPLGKIAGFGIGAKLSFEAAKIGGAEYNPAGNWSEQPTGLAKVMWLLNEAATKWEQVGGLTTTAGTALASTAGTPNFQKNIDLLKDPEYRKALWEASRVYYEYSNASGILADSQNAPAMVEAWMEIAKQPGKAMEIARELQSQGMKGDLTQLVQAVGQRLDPKLRFADTGEAMVLGQAEAIKDYFPTTKGIDGKDIVFTPQIILEATDYIQKEMAAGRPRDEVVNEVIQRANATVGGLISDFAGQAIADPLNIAGEVASEAVGKVAQFTGHETAARAFVGPDGMEVSGPVEGAKRYQTMVQTGDVAPGFKYDEMSGLSRFFGQVAIDESGKPTLRAGKFTDKPLMATAQNYFATLDPVSRARVGLGLANDNVLAMMTMFNDPGDVVQFWNSVRNGDMELAREMGARFVESPEFYTILPALKNFDMEKMVSTWEATRPSAAAIDRVAQALGDTPYNIIDDIATPEKAARTFERVRAALADSTDAGARALLEDITVGRFTADDLATAGKIFNGDAAAPYDLGQWKAMTADAMTTHFAEWARDFFKLQPDSMFFRAAATMKSAQSLLLLGFNPSYAINNGINNMVTRAATGNFGFMVPHQIEAFLARLEIDPYRMSEGVGAAGEVKPGVTRKGEQVISQAVRQKGFLADAKGIISGVGDKLGFAQKASAAIEKIESRNAFAVGMKKAWGQMWQRGRGFRHMDTALKQAIDAVYPGGSEIIYRAIEAGMNQREIESAILRGQKQLRSRSFVGEVARRMGIDAAQATTMLDQIGLLDRLDGMLEKVRTDSQIDTTFNYVERQAQDWIDARLADDFAQRAEHVRNRVRHEGWQSVGDIYIDTELSIQERWLEHYSAFEDVFSRLDDIEDPVLFNNLLEDTYRQQGREWRRVNRQQLTVYKGLADALGLGETAGTKSFLAEQAAIHNLWDEAYAFRMEETARYTDQFKGDWANPLRHGERDSLRARIDAKFRDTFKKVQRAEKRMGDLFAEQFRGFGPDVEKMAGQYWNEVTGFRGKMWAEMQEFRQSLFGLDYDTRRKVSHLFWHERYPALIKEFEALKINGASELNRRMNGRGGDLSGLGAEPPKPAPTEGSGGSAVPLPDPDAVAIDNIFQIANEYGIASADAAGNPLFGANNHILTIVRKYGGDEGARVARFADLADTPELVRGAFETRAEAKAIETAKTAGEVFAAGQDAASAIKAPKITANTAIMTAITRHGGLDITLRGDVLGEARYKGQGFKKGGFGLDEMARMLADDGYPIDMNAPSDPGGTLQLAELIGRATRGEDVYPVFHDYDAQLAREQTAAAEAAVARTVEETAWKADEFTREVRQIEETVAQLDTNDPFADQKIDFNRLAELMDDLPEEIADAVTDSGETYRDHVMRVYGEAEAKATEIRQTRDIASKLAAHDAESVAVKQFQDMVMTREIFREQLMDNFNLTTEEADAVTSVTDARAEAWAQMTGKDAAEWYATRLEGVTKGGGGELFQTDYAYPRIDLPDRTMTPQEVEGFARALSRTTVDDVRRAVSDETTRAAKIRLLDEVHKLAPDLAEGAARQLSDSLFQTVKDATGEQALGAIDFMEDGRAIIRAFDKGNVSTVVHEIGHIFRRELEGKDLATVEEWAGVKNGEWSRAAEEKFARGFEKYLADGQAPTPKLKAVFEKFKTWMTTIYRQITGSPIDVNLTDDVRGVFDRLLAERRWIEEGADRRQPAYQQLRQAWGGLDEVSRTQALDWILKRTLTDPMTGLETLVAKEIEGRKPAGWVDASSDLNALKAINDTYGHDVGDKIIAGLGKVVNEEVEKVGGRAFRTGGDEITYWFPDQSSAETAMKAIDERFSAERFNITGKNKKGFTISYGIGDDAKIADVAMYADKERRTALGQRAERGVLPASIVDDDMIRAKAKEMAQPQELYQTADPRAPYGSYEQAAGYTPDGVFMDDGWGKYVKPLLEGMRDEAKLQLREPEFKLGGFDDATQRDLKRYINQVKGDMATIKLSAVRYAESMRDFALLNYNRRYGFDKYLDVLAPYQFWYTRSMMNWGLRTLDRPAWFANYARLKMMQNRYQNNLPERLRGKIRIPAPWMPDWMGDALYVDPGKQLFPFVNMMSPFEQMQRDRNYQTIEAERILQEWAQDGTMTEADVVQAAKTQEGPTWEKALAEAKIRREAEISNPLDFMSVMFGPAWYISTPMRALGLQVPFFNPKGEGPESISELPITRTGRAFETVTEGTWAEPAGKLFGLLGKPEEWVRKKAGLPEYGEYGDYYTKRQLANMVADGLLTTEQAQQAMLEKQGEAWDEARRRVEMELAMRVPLAGTMYAGLHEGAGAALQATPAALLGSGLLPEGELRYRGLKEKWDAAWKEYDAGNTDAVNQFFDDHPEYEAYLAKGKDEGELLRSFLVGQVWDSYMAIDKANRKVVTGQMGPLFQQSFLNKETRSYDSIDTETLAMWARTLKGQVPQVEATQVVTQAPQYMVPQIEGIPAPLSGALNNYETWKAQTYPGINDIQGLYYGVPKSERRMILSMYPQLKEYWTGRRQYLEDHPEVAQFIDSDTANAIIAGELQPIGMDAEQARRVLTYYRPSDYAAPARTAEYYLENATPALRVQIASYALTGVQPGGGAMTELQAIWEDNGRPGDSFQSFLDDIILPTLLIGQGQ